MVSKVVFSSDRMDWGTPQAVFDELHEEFGFTVDGAANPYNAMLPRFFCDPSHPDAPVSTSSWTYNGRSSWKSDGLAQNWEGETVWVNPPYGRDIRDWIRKGALFEADVSVFLIPSRTDTTYWHEFIWDRYKHLPRVGVQVRFLKGRIRFRGAKHGAPFPSVVVVFSRELLRIMTIPVSHFCQAGQS